jgi:guanylate kinase
VGEGAATTTAPPIGDQRIAREENVLLDIDVQGCEQVRAKYRPQTVCSPSLARGPRAEAARPRNRAGGARGDASRTQGRLARKFEYDYIVVNDDLERRSEPVARDHPRGAVPVERLTDKPNKETD